MRAEEKAKELVERFIYNEGFGITEDSGVIGINKYHQAKQCALICIDEMESDVSEHYYNNRIRDYYNDLRREIEKL